ncbi:MAG: large-conductance mechanosensitive channel protein MscL [Chloroflexi bacterium]|nr:large-conductance mechanosensitive channel protein MscL [Chloroflexota bacterium]
MLKEFQKFIMRGNVLDLAVGIIIGAAFTTIVNSLVNDIIMPPIGWLLGGVDFSGIVITLPASPLAAADAAPVTINVGMFINTIINFLIVAFAVFLLVRSVNNMMERFKKQEEVKPAAPAGPTTEEKLVAAIDKLNKYLETK